MSTALPLPLDVLLFASAADAFGAPRITVQMPAGATAADVHAAVLRLARERMGVALPHSCRLAVNHVFASPELPVGPGDELALIPPVAGG